MFWGSGNLKTKKDHGIDLSKPTTVTVSFLYGKFTKKTAKLIFGLPSKPKMIHVYHLIITEILIIYMVTLIYWIFLYISNELYK